jgi:hypothetical protein
VRVGFKNDLTAGNSNRFGVKVRVHTLGANKMSATTSMDGFLASDLADLRETMHDRGVMFCFSGYMTETILTGIAGAVRQKLEVEDADRRTMKGLFSIFIELVQNVIRYSTEKYEKQVEDSLIDLRYGVITVGRRGSSYYVACGNMISNHDVERLRVGLDRILELDKEGLKSLYKETLKGPTPETSKGAGVGFIEIARRAPNGFTYDIKPVDDEYSFFAVKADI